MKALRQPSLEERLRKPLRDSLRRSPALRRQARAVWFARQRRRLALVGGLLFVTGLATALGASLYADSQVPPGVARLVLAIIALLLPLAAANSLATRLGGDPALLALALLPVEDGFRLRYQMRRWFQDLAANAFGSSALLLGLGGRLEFAARWFASVLAGGVGLGLITGALGLLMWRHGWLARVVRQFLFIACAIMAGCFFFAPLRAPVIAAVAPVADLLTLALPSGWVIYPLHRWLTNPTALAWLPLLPAVSLVLLAVQEGRAALPEVPLRDLTLLGYAAQPPEGISEEVREEFHRQLERPASPPAAGITAAIRSRRFLEALRPSPTDRLFRLVWRWWTPRQRLLGEWGLAAWPQWEKRWLLRTALAGGALLVAALARGRPEALVPVGATALAGFAGASLLPWVMLFQRAMRRQFLGNVSIPHFYLHSATLAELLAADRKRIGVQVALAMPVIVSISVAGAWLWGQPASLGLVLALKLVLVFFALRGALLTAWCARQMLNRPKTYLFLPVLLLGGAITVVLEVVGLSFPEPPMLLLAGLGVLLMQGLAWVTLRLWSRRWFENTL